MNRKSGNVNLFAVAGIGLTVFAASALAFAYWGKSAFEQAKVASCAYVGSMQMAQDCRAVEARQSAMKCTVAKEKFCGDVRTKFSDGNSERSVERSFRAVQPSWTRPSFAPPSDTPGTERYAAFAENEFMSVAANPLSTFSVDVDTASYAMARRFLLDMRRMPAKDAVRLEEFVNSFDYGYAEPKDGRPVAVHCEIGDCPWAKEHRLLRVGLQAKRIATDALPPNNLVFLIDVSGSMSGPTRLELAKRSFKLLVDQLREEDHVSVVTYANDARVVLASTSGRERARIRSAIDSLYAGGGTSGIEGLHLAYAEAERNFDKKANNRVVMASDGDFNMGMSSTAELERYISEKRKTGVYLSVLGFGMGNYRDELMKKLSSCGNGNYAVVDNILEAKKVMVTKMAGTLVTVAKDVKLQLEFNPARVAEYRLLGYESRLLKDKDFNDDKKDAGEMGAGHSVTALYEIVPVGTKESVPAVDKLRYQKNVAVESAEMLTVKLRWKKPDSETSERADLPFTAAALAPGKESESLRFATAVAEAAMLLRDSKWKGGASWDDIIDRAKGAKGADESGYRAEFIRLAETAQLLSGSDRN